MSLISHVMRLTHLWVASVRELVNVSILCSNGQFVHLPNLVQMAGFSVMLGLLIGGRIFYS